MRALRSERLRTAESSPCGRARRPSPLSGWCCVHANAFVGVVQNVATWH